MKLSLTAKFEEWAKSPEAFAAIIGKMDSTEMQRRVLLAAFSAGAEAALAQQAQPDDEVLFQRIIGIVNAATGATESYNGRDMCRALVAAINP